MSPDGLVFEAHVCRRQVAVGRRHNSLHRQARQGRRRGRRRGRLMGSRWRERVESGNGPCHAAHCAWRGRPGKWPLRLLLVCHHPGRQGRLCRDRWPLRSGLGRGSCPLGPRCLVPLLWRSYVRPAGLLDIGDLALALACAPGALAPGIPSWSTLAIFLP